VGETIIVAIIKAMMGGRDVDDCRIVQLELFSIIYVERVSMAKTNARIRTPGNILCGPEYIM